MKNHQVLIVLFGITALFTAAFCGYCYYRQHIMLEHFAGFMFDEFEFSGFAGCNQMDYTSITDANDSGVFATYKKLTKAHPGLIYIEFEGRFDGPGTSGIGPTPFLRNIDIVNVTTIKKLPYTSPLFCNAKHPLNEIFMEPSELEFVPDGNENSSSSSESKTTP